MIGVVLKIAATLAFMAGGAFLIGHWSYSWLHWHDQWQETAMVIWGALCGERIGWALWR